MCRRIIDLFKKKPQEESFVDRIKNLSLNKDYLSNLKKVLMETNFENINIIEGEFTNLDRSSSDECCIDVYFEKEYLHMLTICSDGILLLKNKYEIQRDERNYSYEDLEYEEVFRINLKKSILPLIDMDITNQ